MHNGVLSMFPLHNLYFIHNLVFVVVKEQILIFKLKRNVNSRRVSQAIPSIIIVLLYYHHYLIIVTVSLM